MKSRPFTEKDKKPEGPVIAEVFGKSHPAYLQILEITSSFDQSWNYAKYNGWTFKIADKKKVLLYVLPLTGMFTISMAIRESERDTLLSLPQLEFAREQLTSAKQYREGFAVQFQVTEENQNEIILFIKELIKYRG